MAEASPNDSAVSRVLHDAQEDLRDANFPWLVGKLFNPLRECVLLPLVDKASEVVPGVTSAVPFGDQIAGFALGTTCSLFKFGYSLLPHQHNVEQEATDVINFELDSNRAMIRRFETNNVISSLLSVFGFVSNMTFDILAAPFNGSLVAWARTLIELFAYLVFSGIDDDVAKAFLNPRAVDNGSIIARIQNSSNAVDSPRERRVLTASSPRPIDEQTFQKIMKDASIYCRFATAAYGVSMIESADVFQVHNKKILSFPKIHWASRRYRERRISKYCLGKDTTKPDASRDILYMTPVGGNMELLGHFVAVHHLHKAVVLAIRGTYSASELIIDANGYTTPFCDGVAHKGIAERALTLWDNPETRKAINCALKDNPTYELIITGHSLGAGAACLLTIKLYYDKKKALPGTPKIRCFAFAPPPVYKASGENSNVQDAINNTTAFVHENDCVPFLSADSVRRLAETFSNVDRSTRGHFFERKLVAAGLKQPSNDLVQTVERFSRPIPVLGADEVAIPAPFVIWMRQAHPPSNGNQNHNHVTYNATLCRPKEDPANAHNGLNNLSILLNHRMIADHMMPNYESGIYSIRAQMVRNQTGYLVKEVIN